MSVCVGVGEAQGSEGQVPQLANGGVGGHGTGADVRQQAPECFGIHESHTTKGRCIDQGRPHPGMPADGSVDLLRRGC